MNKNLIIGLIVVVVVLGGGYFLLGKPNVPANTNDSQQTENLPPTSQEKPETTPPVNAPSGDTSGGGPQTYTMADVAKHNGESSCWTAIDGKVYDVTDWIHEHPGGPGAILSLCGKDGSAAFEGQHGGQARPAAELTNFFIGALAL